MKKSILTAVFTLFGIIAFAQEPKQWAPAYFSKDYVVVAINAHTTDSELLQIRKNILKYSMIRFTNFDVIRSDDGSIYFLSMEVDCRDGYSGKISHAFEPGDTTYYGFVRDYSLNTYKKPFFIGNLLSPYSGINHVEEYIQAKKEEETDDK
ncbi:MAG: hypothetical protein IJ759_04185 [Bacteroidales bacterium]|nr:hypothetical protein [Bacteroidales bacterium]